MCAGAVVLVPAAPSDAGGASTASLSQDLGLAAPAYDHVAMTSGTLAADPPDSTDDDDNDDGDEAPTGSIVLAGRPDVAQTVAVEFRPHVDTVVVRPIAIDSHSLRAPPQ